MLITCPSCADSYDLPSDRIGPAGRKVRCASCRESWFVATPVEKPDLDLEAEAAPAIDMIPRAVPAAPVREEEDAAPLRPAPAAPPPKRRQPEARGRKAPRRAGQAGRSLRNLAAAAAVVVGLPSLVLFRADVVAAAPGTASLYAAMGLPVNLVGLKLAAIRSVLVEENGTPVLEVSGDITNVGRAARAVPPLRISIEGESGAGLDAWSVRAAEGELEIGRTVPFQVRLTAPPPGSRRVEVTFKEAGPRKALARAD